MALPGLVISLAAGVVEEDRNKGRKEGMTGGTRLDRARRSVRKRLGRWFGSEVKAEAGGRRQEESGAQQNRIKPWACA